MTNLFLTNDEMYTVCETVDQIHDYIEQNPNNRFICLSEKCEYGKPFKTYFAIDKILMMDEVKG